MAEFDFADRYAEAGLSPTADVITNRQATAARIVDEIDNKKILDLVACYYSGAGLDLGWMRDQFAQEDASFSLVNNARECRVLAAVLLGQLVSDGTDVAALAVAVGSLAGKRSPVDAPWLVQSSLRALAQTAIAEREAADVETKVNYTAVPKFAEEITAWPHGDWPALQAILGKMRTESQSSMRAMSTQATTALTALNLQLRLQREETQMLWWLFGGHSRSLERAFSSFDMPQAALVAAVDLACLTTVSNVGPIAVPAMLDRVICLARKPKAHASRTLESAVVASSATISGAFRLRAGWFPRRWRP
jgi:hypothetical protein